MTDEDDGVSLLDEEGRLFGVVNVVDALVVLLILAVVVAGVALLLPSGSGDPGSRFVTMDLGIQPDFVAEEVSPGDTWEPEQTSDELVITDVYRTPGGDGTQISIRAEVNGTIIEPDDPNEEPTFAFLDDPLRVGESYNITTSEYEAEAQIIRVDQTGEQLSVAETPFVIETTVSESVAAEVEAGDTFQLSGETVATIETVERLSADEDQRLLLGMRGQTIEQDGVQLFGDAPLRIGATVEFVSDGYELTGTVRQRGTANPELATQSVVVETTVSADTAGAIEAGDTFSIGDTAVANIESVILYPAGENQQTALLGLNLSVTRDGIERFGGRPVRIGNDIPFRTDDYELSTTIRQRGTANPELVTQSVVVDTTVSADTAEVITAGDVFSIGDTTIATIESVSLYPAGEDQRTALLGLNLSVTRDNIERFGGQPVRIGNDIPFRTEDYELSTTIRQRDTTVVDTVRRPFVIETTVTDSIAPDITVGDTFNLAGQDIVTVESVTSYISDTADQQRVFVGVETAVREEGNELLFGNQRLQVGDTLPVRTGEYDITGEIVERGTLDQPGERTTRTVTLGVDNIPPERAASLTVGLREQSRDLMTAEVQEKVSKPAVIVLDGGNGDVFRRESPDIFRREHPVNRDVELEIELTVRELADGTVRFRGEPLRTGEQLTLELGSVRITGEVFEIRD